MDQHPIIFYWSGYLFWIGFGILLALALLIASTIAVVRVFWAIRRWNRLWKLLYLSNTERALLRRTRFDMETSDEQIAWLFEFADAFRKHLKHLPKGPLMRGIRCSELYEMTDGSVAKCVQVSPGPESDTQTTYRFKDLQTRQEYEVQADGRCKDNWALRVVRCQGCEPEDQVYEESNLSDEVGL